MKQNWINVSLFGAMTFTPAAFAEIPTEPIVLDEMVVTATRMPQPLAQAIADTTVINEPEIRQSGAPDVPTLLRSLVGIEVAQNGGMGKVSSTFVRGTNSSHILVLLDGVRINSATDGRTALEHIMPDSIERIEVVRGNVSSLYGSEAIGGVIQMFTKRGKGVPSGNASIGLGSRGTQRLSAGYSGSVNDTSFSMNVGKTRTDGVSAINTSIKPAANPDNDGYDNTSVNAQIQYVLNANHLLSAALFKTQGDSQYDDPFGVATDSNKASATIDKLSLASENQWSPVWHNAVRLAQGQDKSRDYKNDVQQSSLQTLSNQFSWENELTIAETKKINLALEHLNQSVSVNDITDPNPYTRTRRTLNSILGGYVAEYGVHQVQFNMRQDRYSDFGNAGTGLLGYGVRLADYWRVTASVSNAFKAPSFNDLYRPAWGGNPNLKPEQANNREAGLHYAKAAQRADLIWFDNRIHNLIAFAAPAYVGQNIDRARIDGMEFSYALSAGPTRLTANLTVQNPRDSTTGHTLSKRARKYGNVTAAHDYGRWNVAAELRYSGERQEGVYTLSGYQLLNLKAGCKVNTHLNILARVDNLFNRHYSEAYGYNTWGRTVFVGLNYQQ